MVGGIRMKNAKVTIWRLALVVSVGIIFYLGNKAREVNHIIAKLDTQIQAANKELEKEQETLDTLQKERESMGSLEYIEYIAREKLGMVKEEDIVFKEKQ